MKKPEPHTCPGLKAIAKGGSSAWFGDTKGVEIVWNTLSRWGNWELHTIVHAGFGQRDRLARIPITHCPFCGEELKKRPAAQKVASAP